MSVCWDAALAEIRSTNLFALMQYTKKSSYDELQRWSVEQPEAFWTHTIGVLGVKFSTGPECFADLSDGPAKPKWFKGAKLNIAASCFARETATAIITKRHTGEFEKVSLAALHALANRVANGLKEHGHYPGDRIAIVMPMTAEAVAIYLGIVMAGMTVVSVPESLPPDQLALRLNIANASCVFTQSFIVRGEKRIPLYERVSAPAGQALRIVCLCPHSETALPTLRHGDLSWEAFMSQDTTFAAINCEPLTPSNIIFSSGTTGTPKAIVWDHTTPLKSASDGHYHQDIRNGDVVCWPTSLGWMMGPWLVYASLLNSATLALFEGGPGDAGFAAFIEEAKVTMLGLVPSIVAGWRQSGNAEGYDWSALRVLSSSGEASNADLYDWLSTLNQPRGVKKPIIEYCGGTEIGGGYVAGNLLKRLETSTFNGPAMGTDFVVLDDSGAPCAVGKTGEVFIKTPALGLSISILNADNEKIYYAGVAPGLRRHGDLLTVMQDGGWRSNGRAGNDMNLNGIKVGSTEIEQAAVKAPGVLEAAAVGVPPADGGPDRLVIFAVLANETSDPGTQERVHMDMQHALKARLGPFYIIHDVVIVTELPRTASNKVMHRELRAQYAACSSATR